MILITAPASVDAMANLGLPSALIFSSKVQTNERTAAISNHYRDCQSNDRKREHYRISGITI